MADQLLSTGLTIDDLETRLAAITVRLRAAISTVLDVSPNTDIGQLAQIFTEHDQQLAELLQEVFSSFDPDQATGQALDALCSITGTYRQAATFGTVAVTLGLDAITTVPAGTVFSVSGAPDNTWALSAAVTSVGAGNYAGSATAQTAGDVEALAGTLTVIVTPVAGLNSVTNASNATPGEERETDAALRLRRELEVTLAGSASVDSIRAAISALTGVLEVYVYENPLNVAVAPMPPHSIEAVFWTIYTGATLTALKTLIAAAIFTEKAAGIQAYGTSSELVTDAQGNDHTIGYTLADEQACDVEVTVTHESTWAGAAAVQTAIATWAAANLGIGDEVYRSQISGVVIDLQGVIDVSLVRLAIQPAGLAAGDLTITARQIATIASGDVTVL